MRAFTTERDERTADEIWVVEHPPVFTRGQRESKGQDGSIEVPGMGPVPVIASDRGGLITYHGPGQMIFYVLIDLKRSGVGIRRLVAALEQAIIDLLRAYGIAGSRIQGAPGVYVEDAKIASLGLRVRNGCTYHGLSLNVDMNMAPFAEIDPCGVPNQPMTLLRALGVDDSFELVAEKVCRGLSERLGYTVYNEIRPSQNDVETETSVTIADDSKVWPEPRSSSPSPSSPANLSAVDVERRPATVAETEFVSTAGHTQGTDSEVQSDRVTTPPGSNLLSHLTSLGAVAEPTETEKPAVATEQSRPPGPARLRDPRITPAADVDAATSEAAATSNHSGIPSEFENVLKGAPFEPEHASHSSQPDDKEQAQDKVKTSRAPKISMARFVRSDDDLGFLKPSNLHELIKDSDKDP